MKLQEMTTNQAAALYRYHNTLGFEEQSDIIIKVWEMYLNNNTKSLIVRDEHGWNPIKGKISLVVSNGH